MAVKRIQLRGISRNPSDRMSPDGGVAESLNMQLEDQESAPVIMAEPANERLGLPADLPGKLLLVHKMKNVKKYVVQIGNAIGAYADGEFKGFCTLKEDEVIKDIVAVGNTIVMSSNISMHYALHKSGKYVYLGTEVPFPEIRLYAVDQIGETRATTSGVDILVKNRADSVSKNTLGEYTDQGEDDVFASPDRIKECYEKGIQLTRASDIAFLTTIKDVISLQDQANADVNMFSYPVWGTYALRLYDDSNICSLPVLLGAGSDYPYDISFALVNREAGNDSDGQRHPRQRLEAFGMERKSLFKIYYEVTSIPDNFSDWSDLIKGVDIYTSPQIGEDHKYLYSADIRFEKGTLRDTYNRMNEWYGGTIQFHDKDYTFEKEALDKGRNMYRQLHIEPSEVQAYNHTEPRELICVDRIKSDQMQAGDRLDKFTFNRYPTMYGQLMSLNGRVVGTNASRVLYMRNHLLSATYHINTLVTGYRFNEAYVSLSTTYVNTALRYAWAKHPALPRVSGPYSFGAVHLIQTQGKDVITEDARYDSDVMGETKIIDGVSYIPCAYTLGMSPDMRTKNMVVSNDGTNLDMSMQPHPNLPCSYYMGDIKVPLLDSVLDADDPTYPLTDNSEELPTQIHMSSSENPFYFPVSGVRNIAGNILKVAATTQPLSEGQFGQYTMYAFTDNGIYAIQSDAVGALGAGDNVAFDISINNDAIIPLSQSILFVTDQGVMVIEGRTVKNISPNMTGEHYAAESDIIKRVRGTRWEKYIGILSDDTRFMSFMKDAHATYDYAGKRVLYFSPDHQKDYAYVLRTESLSWHKVSLPEGIDFDGVTNSYPDALVAFSKDGNVPIYKDRTTLYAGEYRGKQESFDYNKSNMHRGPWMTYFGWTPAQLDEFLDGTRGLVKTDDNAEHAELFFSRLREMFFYTPRWEEDTEVIGSEAGKVTTVYDYSTFLNEIPDDRLTDSVIITRAFDLDDPDILKSISDLRIRGHYPKHDEFKHVQFLLLGSQDGYHYHLTGSLRGKSWKLYRLAIFMTLRPNERISWVDIDYTTRFTNKLR